jgi:hypothetical protein
MKYIGNFKEWIEDQWVREILQNRGYGRPCEGTKPDSPEMENEYSKARAAGYNDNEIYFYMFDETNVSFKLPKPPFIEDKFHWWITKMMPGNFMPMHIDPHTLIESNSKRFWMPLQDWDQGHIFMYENQVVTNYKAGDVWVYQNSNALHGAANIGYSPRLILQVSSYD